MPTADVCGNCHLQEFAERESERDTITWPKDQWPKGRPSHALDYRANVEVEVYAGMSQREIADGCTDVPRPTEQVRWLPYQARILGGQLT